MLRKRQGIYEYTRHRECLFRAEACPADQTVLLGDGTLVRSGEPMLKLHLWNEQVPSMGRNGPTIGWAHRLNRAVDVSLRELTRYLHHHDRMHQVLAVCADMRLGSSSDSEQLIRIAARYGFEIHDRSQLHESQLHRVGELILICMLVLATNPAALRGSTLRRDIVRVYLSRSTLEQRYRAVLDQSYVSRGHAH
jgi:hypothetical protein